MKKFKQVFYEEKKRNFKMLKDCTCEGLKHCGSRTMIRNAGKMSLIGTINLVWNIIPCEAYEYSCTPSNT